jgi:hypothetical protein
MNLINFVAIEIKLDTEKNQIHNKLKLNLTSETMATFVNLIRFLKKPTDLDGTCYVSQCSKFFFEKSIKYQLKK